MARVALHAEVLRRSELRLPRAGYHESVVGCAWLFMHVQETGHISRMKKRGTWEEMLKLGARVWMYGSCGEPQRSYAALRPKVPAGEGSTVAITWLPTGVT